MEESVKEAGIISKIYFKSNNEFHIKINSSCKVAPTAGIRVSPMSIPKISVKVTGCPEAFLVHRAWM